MANEFRRFLNFVHEATGRYPEKFADSFRDIYIYVPDDKTPPKASETSSSTPTVPVEKYFTARSEDFRTLVYHEDWLLLENCLGSDLLRFCLTECIFAKRTRTGAFMVSNLTNLHEKLTAKPIERLHEIFHRTAACRRASPIDDSAMDWDDDDSESLPELQKILDSLFSTADMEISTDYMLFQIQKNTNFPEDCVILNSGKSGSLQVLETKIGSLKVVKYAKDLEPLDPVLQKFKKAHMGYGYESALYHLLTTSGEDGQKFENQLTIPVLQTFFRNIFQTVVPKELFQTNKNMNVVLKIISDLLLAPKSQSVRLKPYLMKMGISDIRWLSGVDDRNARWCIFGKFLIWFFDKYILNIFISLFYTIVPNSYEKIYFRQRDWRTMTSQFLCKMREDNVITNTNGLDSRGTSCHGNWVLFPKKKGMRPIMSRTKGFQPGAMTKVSLCYLQQLHMTKYGQSGKQVFFEKWRDLVVRHRSAGKKTMYLVSCDIESAFESIDQRKLLKIVGTLVESTARLVKLRYYKIARDFKAVKSGWFQSKQCVTYPELEMPIATDSIFSPCTTKVVRARTELLFRIIRQNILNQCVTVSGQMFLLQKGIAQGAILSSVLCDLYYSHMEETLMSEFKEEGFLHRYVDDFLFATDDKALAERFLERVKQGYPEYNCSFKAAKTRSNLPGHSEDQKPITYLGFNIDPNTLEVTPEWAKSPRYSTILSRPPDNVTAAFQKRLLNLASLKLEGIILDCKVNSEETILYNVREIFMRQAERCLWLLKALFDDIPRNLSEIYRVIRLSNREIFIRIQRYYLANGYDFKKLQPHFAVIPWAAYRQVFGKQQTIHAHFRSLFLENLKLSLQAAANKTSTEG